MQEIVYPLCSEEQSEGVEVDVVDERVAHLTSVLDAWLRILSQTFKFNVAFLLTITTIIAHTSVTIHTYCGEWHIFKTPAVPSWWYYDIVLQNSALQIKKVIPIELQQMLIFIIS